MSRVCFFFGLIFFLASCAETDPAYKVESIILNCFYQHEKDNNIEIKSTIQKIESVLLKHNILADKSGDSFIKVVEKFKADQDVKLYEPSLVADIIAIGYIPSGVYCSDFSYASMLDSADLANSKLVSVIEIFEAVQVEGKVSPSLIAEDVLEVFSSEDFENEYYRTIGLITLANFIKMNNTENMLYNTK